MGKIAKGVNNINFTMLYGNYYYIIIEKFHQKFSPCRRVCKCQLFLRSVSVMAALTRDRVLHYLPRQMKFHSLSFHVIGITRLFQRNKLLYYLERCPFTKYVG